MKITTDGQEASKSVLEDDAAIYAKRDERSAKERFKDLSKADKWQFFKDYVLVKLIVGIIIAALACSFLYSVFGPKPDTIMYIAMIDNPLDNDKAEALLSKLNERFVTDSKKEQITLDKDFYFATGDYNTRMKFVTMTAGTTLDFVIMPAPEFDMYMQQDYFSKLADVVSPETRSRLSGYEVMVNGEACAYDVSEWINAKIGVEAREKYYAACIVNSAHRDRFEGFIDFIFEDMKD